MIFQLMPNGIFKKMGIGKRELIQLTKSMMALDFKEDLDKVDCRTLIVCGEKDRANRGASEMMAEKIHGARIKILEGCGHEVNVEAPEKLAEILEAFYEEKQDGNRQEPWCMNNNEQVVYDRGILTSGSIKSQDESAMTG